jgi:Mrp family chromosome partitioning ATPase
MMIGLIVGVVLAGFAVFVKDQFDDSIRLPEDIEYKLGLSLLGVIPAVHKGDPETEMADPKSGIAEAYNSLRGSLLYSTPEGLPHVLLITSAQPSEARPPPAMPLPAALRAWARRWCSSMPTCGAPRCTAGSTATMARPFHPAYLARSAQYSGAASALPNLTLVTSGPIPPSPTELLSSVRLEQILQEAAGQFDVVVLDSPPILGLADAPMMSALADGVVFVVEADRSRHGSLKAALRRLRAMRPVILGGVLTKFDPLKSGNRYTSYYGYEYYQYQYRYGDDLK